MSDDLHATVRKAMEGGALPTRAPVKWVGVPASGTRCAACGTPTTFGEFELKLDFGSDLPGLSPALNLHPRCFRIFLLELGSSRTSTTGMPADEQVRLENES